MAAQTTSAPIRLAAGHDIEAYARVFQRAHRIHIAQFLNTEDALRLHKTLVADTPWQLTAIQGQYFSDTPEPELQSLPAEERARLEAELHDFAARDFAGRYSTCRLSEQGELYQGSAPELVALTRFLNGPAFLDLVRRVTGRTDIDFADAQATRYGPGDFLHPHFDRRPDKKRAMAYVLNLTPKWRVEWGGLLGFIGPDNHLTEAYTPAWNALNLLDVNELHYVSCVAPFAPQLRYSITGWLRSR